MDNKDTMFGEIIAGLRARDDRVREHIYKFFWGHMMGVASRYFNDRTTIREVVNDSFLKSFNTMYDFRHEGDAADFQQSFRSWLATITVRTALDRIRKTKAVVVYTPEYEGAEEITGHDVSVEEKLRVQDILKLLYELPEIHRAVFNLFEIEGYSHEEISSALLIPVSSSRTFLSRAKQKMRELYIKRIVNGNERS